MEENKNINKMKKIIIIGISIMCIILVIIVITGNNKKTEISSNLENTENVVEGETIFEDIGHYSVAVAGNNNADRGTAWGSNDRKLIKSYPENWEEIKKNIPSNILSRINNISGSRLDFNGLIKKSWLTTNIVGISNVNDGDILIIKPDGTYEIFYKSTKRTIEINITDSGWYYVSLLDAPVQPQHAWALTAIYENENLPIKYVNLIYANININGSTQPNFAEVNFNNKFSLNNRFDLFGVFIAGASAAWPREGYSEDKVEAILSDGTYKQLYEDTYNGKTIFEGRTNTDFVNGTFNTIRSHNIKGGELDIFYEELGKDYFNGNEILGYKMTMMGQSGMVLQLMGLLQEIYMPKFTFNIEKSKNNLIENESIHIKTNMSNVATNEESVGYDTKIVYKLDEALSEVTNIVVKIDDSIVNAESVYNADTNEIIINGIEEILPNQVVTIEYYVKVNSNIQNKGEINSNVELPIEVNVQSYPIDMSLLEEEEKSKYENLYIESEEKIFIERKIY